MTTNARNLRTFGIVLFLTIGGLATAAHATDCYRYITFDGTKTSFDVNCAQQLNVPPIFVQDTPDGYDIVVPPMYGTSSPYNRFPAASMDWLSNANNLVRAQRVIEWAENNSEFWPLTSEGGVAKIEYVNYTLASFLNTSGATTAIASMANNTNLWGTSCDQIPLCTACQFYLCPPPSYKCDCYFAVGPDCCVIHKTMRVLLE